MGNLVVVIFPDAAKIAQGIRVLKDLHAEGSGNLHASAVVAKDSGGKLSVQKVTKEGFGGTAVGALIGGLAGLPVGPLAATIGAAGGALIGNSADLIDNGAFTEFADKTSGELALGSAAIVAEVSEEGLVAFETLMKAIGGAVVRRC